MSTPRQVLIRRVTTTGVIGLALAGFLMSYEALHRLAQASGVSVGLAWLWPLVVDGFIVVASVAVVHATLDGRRTAYPWLLMLGFSALSVTFNVLHAQPLVTARLVAAVPPLVLVLSFELLMRQLRADASQWVGPRHTVEDVPTPSRPALVDLTAEPAPRRTKGPVLVARAREICAQHQMTGEALTGKTLAARLGVSDSYAHRLLRQLAADAGGEGR